MAPSFPPEKNDMFEISAISMAFTSQLCPGRLMYCRSSDNEFFGIVHCTLEKKWYCTGVTANFAVLLTLLI